jgi:hypothetical protein
MDPRRVVRSLVLAPKRFLDWVYQPDAPLGPSRGQAVTHFIANGHGLDTSRWMRLEAEERRHRATVLRASRIRRSRSSGSPNGPSSTQPPSGS